MRVGRVWKDTDRVQRGMRAPLPPWWVVRREKKPQVTGLLNAAGVGDEERTMLQDYFECVDGVAEEKLAKRLGMSVTALERRVAVLVKRIRRKAA
jgi:hypothetical protein